jgi:hypothetical protein
MSNQVTVIVQPSLLRKGEFMLSWAGGGVLSTRSRNPVRDAIIHTLRSGETADTPLVVTEFHMWDKSSRVLYRGPVGAMDDNDETSDPDVEETRKTLARIRREGVITA